MREYESVPKEVVFYRAYIENHICNVKGAYKKYRDILATTLNLSAEELFDLWDLVQIHDESKYSNEEFEPYRSRFFPRRDEVIDFDEFNKAWLHHIHYNPHHPEHWVLYDKGKETIFNMPRIYIAEMICDWIAMGEYKKNTIWDYYNTKGKDNRFSNETRIHVERCIEAIKEYDNNAVE